jgi:hypothetical protein
MKKIKILLLTVFFALAIVACTATPEDIKFYLNPGIDTIEINSEYDDPGVTARVFGINRSTEIIENTLDVTKIGSYHITYNFVYQDYNLTLVRIVTVIDETPPVLELNPGIDTIKVNETWQDASISYYDNSEDEVSFNVEGFVNNTITGTYIITYTIIDSSGNESHIYRYVNVIN